MNASRNLLAVTVVVLVAIGLYAMQRHSFQLGVYTDDAEYILLAEAIAEGRAYEVRLAPDVGVPSKYPVGWPLVLSWFGPALQWDLVRLPLIAGILTVAAGAVGMLTTRAIGFADSRAAMMAWALFALSPLAVSHSAMAMSEPAFLLATLLALAAVHMALSDSEHPVLAAMAAGALVAFVIYIRTIGIALALAAAIGVVAARHLTPASKLRRSLAMFLGGVMLSVGIVATTSVVWSDLAGGVGIYTAEQGAVASIPNASDQTTSMIQRTANGLADYALVQVRDALVPFVGSPSVAAAFDGLRVGFVPAVVGGVLTVLVGVGLAVTLRTAPATVPHIYVLIAMGILVVWPWRGVRFLYPVSPWLFAYLIIGLQALFKRLLPSEHASTTRALLAALVVASLGTAQIARSMRITASVEHVPDLWLGTSWLKENAPVTSVVASEGPLVVWALYADRPIVGLEPRCAPDLSCALDGVDYILVRPTFEWRSDGHYRQSALGKAVAEWAARSPETLERVYHHPPTNVAVYRVQEP